VYYDTQLATTYLIHAHFSQQAILSRKVGQADLVFGMQSGFISGCVRARLQVSVCSGYDLCNLVDIQTDTQRQTGFYQLIKNNGHNWCNLSGIYVTVNSDND